MPFDLSYYKKYINFDSTPQDNIQELSDAYSQQYNNSISKFSILISSDRVDTIYKENLPIKCIVDYGREIRKSDFTGQLFREVWIEHNTVKTGDVVDFESKNSKERSPYMFISGVESRDSYDISFMQKCNNVLTFKNSLGKKISIPCVISNLTLYSDGLETKTLTLLDGKRNCIIPLTNETKGIFVQQRFIFNHNSIFSVSLIDDFSVNGLLQLTMIQDMFKSTDDKLNNLADNSILPITITFSQTSYTINQYNTLKLNPIITQGNEILILSTKYTVESVENTGFVSVDNLGNVYGVNVGEGKVICSLVGNEDVKCELDFRVLYANPVPTVSYLISGNDVIKKTTTNTYVASKLINNIEDNLASFNFYLDYNGLPTSSVVMTIVDSKSVKIKSNTDNGEIILRVEDTVSGTNTYKTIMLKGIYG